MDSVQSVDALPPRLSPSPVDTRPSLDDSGADEISNTLHTLFAELKRYDTIDSRPGFELHEYACHGLVRMVLQTQSGLL